MTTGNRGSVYRVERLSGRLPELPGLARLADAGDAALVIGDESWSIAFRYLGVEVTCALLDSRVTVHPESGRRCTVAVETDDGASLDLVVRTSAGRLERDLTTRRSVAERELALRRDAARGAWWCDETTFSSLGWSGRLSIAGVRYRAGWWGTGRLRPNMTAKVLDVGPSGFVLRGFRTKLVIPWDAVASVDLLAGDAWRPVGLGGDREASSSPGATGARRRAGRHSTGSHLGAGGPVGTSLVIRSVAGQDAVFFTPIRRPREVATLLEPIVARLGGRDPTPPPPPAPTVY